MDFGNEVSKGREKGGASILVGSLERGVADTEYRSEKSGWGGIL